jgi:hypothetical protein
MEPFFVALFAIIVGLLFTFAGYQFFRALIPVWGFFAGFAWGAQAIAVGLGEGFLASVTGWVVGFLVALVIAALAYYFYELGVGILVAFISYWLSMGVLTQIGLPQAGFFATIVALFVGVSLGIAALYFKAPKGILVALSAFGGATATIGGIMVMFGVIPIALLGTDIVGTIFRQSLFWVGTWIALAAVGIANQLTISREMGDYTLVDPFAGYAGVKGGEASRTQDAIEEDAEDVDIVETHHEPDHDRSADLEAKTV